MDHVMYPKVCLSLHLYIYWQALMEKLKDQTAVLEKVEAFAAQLEELDGTKKNGSSDVLSRRNDIQQNWTSFTELREETDLRLRAAYSQLQVQYMPYTL